MILPKKDNEGHLISSKELAQYANAFSNYFQGITVNPKNLGCFYSNTNKRLECEETLLISSIREIKDEKNMDLTFKKDREFLETMARIAGRDFSQETIFISEAVIENGKQIPGRRLTKIRENKLEKDIFARNL